MSDRRPHPNTDITAEQVTQAIVQLMRGSSGDGHVDNALAASLAGQVLPAVQKQFAGKSSTQLGTEPAFRSLVSLHIATATTPDPGVVRLNTGHHNIHGADHAAAERAGLHGSAHGRFAALITGVGVDRGSGMPELSATNGNLTLEQARNMAAARSLASELGIGWAAGHPDLLKLGPAAIKAIAETNLRETGYKALRNGAFYEAPDIVAFAKHAKLRGFDAEKAAKSTEALIQGLPPGEQQSTSRIMRDFDHAAAAHFANPSDAAAKARYEAAGRAQKQRMEDIAKRSEADRARVQRLEDDKRIQQEFRATTVGNEHARTVERQHAEVKEQVASAKKTVDLGDLDDPAPAKPENPQQRAEAAPAPGSAPATTTAAPPPADKAPAEKTQTAAAPPKPSAPKMA
jgi:hypothetical protein